MKAYIASTFKLADDLARIAALLRAAGWEVPDQWWNVDEKGRLPQDPAQFYAHPTTKAILARHWAAIRACDALVLVADVIDETRFTGAAIEYGYAQGLGIPCVIVGRVKNSAMYAGAIHCPDWKTLVLVMADLNYHNTRE